MKKTTVLSLVGGALVSVGLFATPSFAQDEGLSVSGNVAFVSDYRFRGISFSDENFAVQGGFDVETSSGAYVGTWASSISGGTELDLYAGYGFALSDSISFDLGAIYYAYPNYDGDFDYLEVYGSTGLAVSDSIGLGLGFAYVPEQENTGDVDNTYLYASGDVAVSETIGLSAVIGYEDGAFGDEKIDWSLGASLATDLGIDLGLTYIGTDLDDDDGTIVFSVSKSL